MADAKSLAFDLGPDPIVDDLDNAQEPTAPSTHPALVDPTTCTCGAPFRFDPLLEGETVGHLHRIGWLICDACKATCVSKRGHCGGAWRVATSGRSITVGGGKLRYEGGGDQSVVAGLMGRIGRLPELEAALRSIARGDGDAVAVARAALEGV